MNCRSFTLLEVLAVVVLLTLAMGAAASAIAGAGDASKVRGMAAATLDLDRRARMLAGAGSRVELSIQADHLSLVNRQTGEQVAQLTLPSGLSIQLLNADDKPLEALTFDRTGCTSDYRILVSLGDHAHTTTIAGLTGWSDDRAGGTR